MKITNVNLSSALIKKYGLRSVKMTRLGKIVVIAGKNGVGKTRLLKAIEEASEWRYENRLLDMKKLEVDIAHLRTQLEQERDYKAQYDIRNALEVALADQAMRLALTATANADIRLPLIRFVPKSLSIDSLSEQTFGMIADRAKAISSLGVEFLAKGTFSYIYTLQRIWHEATHVNNRGHLHSDYREEAIHRYNLLQGLLQDVLDTRLTRSEDGFPCLFGQSLDWGNFSEGQKVLLQLVVALHAQDKKLHDVILLLDEPENHLHSSVLIEIFDRLRNKIHAGQIWICTHSIPLIAHIAALDPYAIWHMEDREVSRAGRKPELVLESLLGKQEVRGSLEDFMRLPHNLALANFAAQSLMPPQAVETPPTDPQLVAISKAIHGLNGAAQKIRLLDYGAGKGRLLGGLVAQCAIANVEVAQHIEYVAYDEFAGDKDTCEQVISATFGKSDGRYFNNYRDLTAKFLHGFDVVVLTNVLHEINPVEWLRLFSKDGIGSLLAPTGHLLIVEDQRLPVGEKAHEFGFILLDTEQLKTLFGVAESDEANKGFVATDVKSDGRIKLHLIAASLLSRVNEKSQRQAICELRQMARREIENLRNKIAPTYDDGQLHGLWTQLYTNASLFLEP